MPKNVWGSDSVDPRSEDYKEIIKNARRMLETPTGVKESFSKASIRKTVVPKTRKFKESGANTKFSCIAEAHESTRQRIDFSKNRIHEGHNAGKEQNSIVYYNFFARQVKPHEGPNVTLRKRWVHKGSKALRLPSGNRGYETLAQFDQRVAFGQTMDANNYQHLVRKLFRCVSRRSVAMGQNPSSNPKSLGSASFSQV